MPTWTSARCWLLTLCCLTSLSYNATASSPAAPDTLAEEPHAIRVKRKDWVTIDILVGVEQRTQSWEQYRTNANIGMASQVRFWDLPLWLDGTFVVSFSGETDADGRRAGPGTSGVWINDGVGSQWRIPNTGFTVFGGGGLAYVWASLTLPDRSKPPLSISEFLGRNVYPDIDESASFWGGYLRAGMTVQVFWGLHVGFCAQGTWTTRRTILGRNLTMDSGSIGLVVGASE